MTILTDEEVEPYRGLRVGPLEIIESISRKTLEKLKSLEEKVIDSNSGCYGLPFYLAHKHHLCGKSVLSLSQELGVHQAGLRIFFSYFDIPMLNRREASIRLHSDPEFKKKRAEGYRRNSEERRTNKGVYGNIGKEVDRDKITRLHTSVPSNMNYTLMERKVSKVSYREVIKTYDEIILHTNGVKDWRELVNKVSENTDIEPEAVESCLRECFKIDY